MALVSNINFIIYDIVQMEATPSVVNKRCSFFTTPFFIFIAGFNDEMTMTSVDIDGGISYFTYLREMIFRLFYCIIRNSGTGSTYKS